ncbi:hypothetical protein Taro_038399, partial [Colocasia esculenta]|nr:hypothetical protein [Colocasia esculenta]
DGRRDLLTRPSRPSCNLVVIFLPEPTSLSRPVLDPIAISVDPVVILIRDDRRDLLTRPSRPSCSPVAICLPEPTSPSRPVPDPIAISVDPVATLIRVRPRMNHTLKRTGTIWSDVMSTLELDGKLAGVKILSWRQHCVPLTHVGGKAIAAKFFRFFRKAMASRGKCGDRAREYAQRRKVKKFVMGLKPSLRARLIESDPPHLGRGSQSSEQVGK